MITVEITHTETETKDLADYLLCGGSVEYLSDDKEEQELLGEFAADYWRLADQRDRLCGLKPQFAASYEAQHSAAVEALKRELQSKVNTKIFHIEN